MIQPVDTCAASTVELRAALERTLSGYFGTPRRIASLARRPSDYRSSFILEEIEVDFDDGTTLPLMFKNVSREALLAAAYRAKPGFLYDPLREIETYRTILSSGRFGTPTCYGAVADPHHGRYWLFLERITGVELGQVGDFAIWQRAAEWLAATHARFASEPDLLPLAQTTHLLHYDGAYYRLWPRRAQVILRRTTASPQSATRQFTSLVRRYDRVIERLVALPATFVHGEFYASNVLVQHTAEALRICPVDWEMAAVGPGLIDLAALVAGDWTEAERESLAMTYYTTLTQFGGWQSATGELLTALDCCRLHLAIQWLGWAWEWTPPARHARDWLGDALQLAEKLGL